MTKMKVEGDLGKQRDGEGSKAFPRKIKAAGAGSPSALPYRKPKIEGGSGPHAV